MQIDKARHLKICEDLGKMKNEDSRGLKRRYKGMNFVPKFQDILYGSKHPKRRRNRRFGPKQHSHAPRHTFSCTQENGEALEIPTHAPDTWF